MHLLKIWKTFLLIKRIGRIPRRGFKEQTEEALRAYFGWTFESNERDDKDKEKSPELEKMIARVNQKMVDFLERYGLNAIVIPSKNVHVIDRTKFSPEALRKFEEKNKGFCGFYSPSKQGLAVLRDYREGKKLPFMQIMAHEMLHLQGFFSYQMASPEAVDVSLKKKAKAMSI